jgi:hypothetical protein
LLLASHSVEICAMRCTTETYAGFMPETSLQTAICGAG